MKKLFALMLSLMLMLSLCGALAEETQVTVNDELTISFPVPEGYTFNEVWYGGILYATFVPEDDVHPTMTLSLGATEEYSQSSINDLSDEELDTLIAASISDFAFPTWAISETAHGTKLIVIDENSDYHEFAEIFTLYDGYFISVLIDPGDVEALTAEEIQTAVDILSDMQFSDKK